MKAVLIFLLSLQVISGCTPTADPAAVAPDGRWMDRTVYFARPDMSDADRNNSFQKSRIKEALQEIQLSSVLGEGYFKFDEVDESSLNTSLQGGTLAEEQKSFILVWPDKVFNDYAIDQVNGVTPDPNAIAVINSANKRKFFIIIRASCFSSTGTTGSDCSNIGPAGLKALIARQLGLLVGMSIKDCASFPNDVMCASAPSASQYSPTSAQSFANALNNALETILLNPSYYK